MGGNLIEAEKYQNKSIFWDVTLFKSSSKWKQLLLRGFWVVLRLYLITFLAGFGGLADDDQDHDYDYDDKDYDLHDGKHSGFQSTGPHSTGLICQLHLV